ncbi:MAG: helix-turn-helix domain-containing protein [Solirubrobacterales bacterium]
MAADGVGEVLRAERLRRGVSQTALGRRTGVPQPAISRIEAGREIPSLERWSRLLAGLGLRPDIELVPLAESPSEPQHTAAARSLSPGERLEQAAGWMRLRDEVRGKAA